MGLWDIILPEATTNYVENPVFKYNVTDGWTLSGTGATRSRDTTRKWRGGASCKLTAGAGFAVLDSNGITVADGESVTVSAWFYRASAITSRIVVRDTTSSVDRVIGTPAVTGRWELVTATWTNTTGASKTVVARLANNGTTGQEIWIGAAQMELKSYATTFVSGDEPGCRWDRAPHASASLRSAEYRFGGRVLNLKDDYNVDVTASLGIGMPPLNHQTQQQAFLDGALFRGVKVQPRPVTLNLSMGSQNNTRSGLHDLRKDLIDVIKPDLVADEDPETPAALFALRYNGAVGPNSDGEVLELTHVAYVAGLELDARTKGFVEETALQMIAYDPYFYELGDESLSFSAVTASLSVNCLARWINNDWDNFSNPSGGPGPIYAIARAANGDLYFGGNFTNWAGIANADYVVRWSKENEAFEALSTGGVDFVVHALYWDPGRAAIWIGGAFTNPHPYLMYYTPGTDLFHAVADGPDSNIRALFRGLENKLYVGGEFTTLDSGGVTVNYICELDLRSLAFSAMSGGTNGTVLALAMTGNRYLWVGGTFTTVGSGPTTSNRLAAWDTETETWAVTFATGCNSSVHALAARDLNAGEVYVGGAFTTFNGDTVNHIFKVNPSGGWEALAQGVNDDVYALGVLDNRVFAGGAFTEASGLALADRVAQFIGGVWGPFDIALPGTDVVYAFHVYPSATAYVVAGEFSGTATFSKFDTTAPAENTGSRAVYPVLRVLAEGGDTVTLRWLKNLRTGRTMLFDYAMAEGEELLVDFRPGQRKVVSSVLGELANQPQPGSDLARFVLLPGPNDLAIFIQNTGSPTITAEVYWRPRHWSADGGRP